MLINNDLLRTKYIELMSDITSNYTKTDLAKLLDISRPTLDKFLNENTDLNHIIKENLYKQRHHLGNKAFKRLLDIISKTQNPKLIQIALEIGELYTNKSEITNRYDDMDDKDIDKTLINLLNRERNKRDKE